jgi:hypothetical protein
MWAGRPAATGARLLPKIILQFIRCPIIKVVLVLKLNARENEHIPLYRYLSTSATFSEVTYVKFD